MVKRKSFAYEHTPLDNSSEAKTAKGEGKSDSYLTDLAKALGEIEEKQATKVKAKATTLDEAGELKANSKELSTINEAVNTAVKTIGESISTAARKQ